MGKRGRPARQVQVVDLGESLPTCRTRVKTLCRRALSEAGVKPARGQVRVKVEWVEKDCRHSHDEIDGAIEGIRDALYATGVVYAPELLDFRSVQRLKATNPHVRVTITGRISEGLVHCTPQQQWDSNSNNFLFNRTGVL